MNTLLADESLSDIAEKFDTLPLDQLEIAIAREQERGNWSNAATLLRIVAARVPHEVLNHCKLACALRQMRDFDGADALLFSQIENWPRSEPLLMELAWVAHHRNDWSEAVSRWSVVLNHFPGQLHAGCCHVTALTQLGRFVEAEHAAHELLARHPQSVAALTVWAWIPHHAANWSVAVARWQAVSRIDPTNVSHICCLATALTLDSRFDEASSAIEAALLRFPNNRDLIVAQSSILQKQRSLLVEQAWDAQRAKLWPSAAELWKKVLCIDPANVAAASCLISALTQAKRFDEAEAESLAIQIKFPSDAVVARSCAWISHTRNDWPSAVCRWRRVTELEPGDASAFACLATALAESGAYDEADVAVMEAMKLDPRELSYQIGYASFAQGGAGSSESERRWAALRNRYRNDTDALGKIGYHQMQMQLRHLDARQASAHLSSSVDLRDPVAQRRQLLISMESLGDNCEFGGVQRKFGAEPLGLLRFASISASNLSLALTSRFEGIGDPDKIRLEVIETGEYIIHDAFGITMHSFVHTHEIPHDRFLAQILRRVVFLRTKLINDLEEGSKLFVYKSRSGMSIAEAVMLHSAIRAYGNTTLLCVLLADQGHRPGHVEFIREGLLVGYISRFAANEGLSDTEFSEWLQICENADSIRRGDHPATAPAIHGHQDLIAPSMLMSRFEAFGVSCEFGGVQRHFGAEPIGLFRFTGIGTNSLVEALNSDLAGVGSPAFTNLTVSESDREYFTSDSRYHMSSHTFIYENEIGREELLEKQCKKISFLKRKMLEDLANGDKIFVHRLTEQTLEQVDLESLLLAIRRYGKGTLLCVGLPDGKAPTGRVDIVREGLLVARIVRRVDHNPKGQADHDFDTWLSVCRQAVLLCANPGNS